MSTDPATPDFAPKQPKEASKSWTPTLIGLLLVVVVVAGMAFFGRTRPNASNEVDPYASKLQVGDIHPSSADNFVGSTVTYLDLQLLNGGEKTLAGGQVQVTFKNSLGQVVQTDTLPLHVLTKNALGGYDEPLDISLSPIAPGRARRSV